MGNKQASQQEPVKKSPHSESLSRLYEVQYIVQALHMQDLLFSAVNQLCTVLLLCMNVLVVSSCIRLFI